MKQTAVEWLFDNLNISGGSKDMETFEQALEMEKMQIFKVKNVSAKEAYKAGQFSMYCGCYEIEGCTDYEEWLYRKFKSE